jgi:hypothetical protein
MQEEQGFRPQFQSPLHTVESLQKGQGPRDPWMMLFEFPDVRGQSVFRIYLHLPCPLLDKELSCSHCKLPPAA